MTEAVEKIRNTEADLIDQLREVGLQHVFRIGQSPILGRFAGDGTVIAAPHRYDHVGPSGVRVAEPMRDLSAHVEASPRERSRDVGVHLVRRLRACGTCLPLSSAQRVEERFGDLAPSCVLDANEEDARPCGSIAVDLVLLSGWLPDRFLLQTKGR